MNSSFFNTLLRTCTDFRFYKDIFSQSFGKTLRYLLLLAVLVTLVLGIRYGIGLNKFSQKTLKWIEDNAPYIEITEGVVKAGCEQPFLVEGEGFVMIIDTTGETEKIDSKYKAGILLTKNKLIVKHDEIRTQEFDLSKIKSFRLDKTTFSKWRKFFVFVLIPFMIIIQFFYFFIAKIIQGLITGLVVVIFKPGLKYSNILNLCIYAMTPVTMLALIVTLLSARPIPLFWIIYIGMYIAFVIGAVKQSSPGSELQ